MQLSISSVTIPRDKPHGNDSKEAKTLPSGQPLCRKALPSGQNSESKASPLSNKSRRLHKYIYKLSLTLFEMKSFVVSTNKTVFQ